MIPGGNQSGGFNYPDYTSYVRGSANGRATNFKGWTEELINFWVITLDFDLDLGRCFCDFILIYEFFWEDFITL